MSYTDKELAEAEEWVAKWLNGEEEQEPGCLAQAYLAGKASTAPRISPAHLPGCGGPLTGPCLCEILSENERSAHIQEVQREESQVKERDPRVILEERIAGILDQLRRNSEEVMSIVESATAEDRWATWMTYFMSSRFRLEEAVHYMEEATAHLTGRRENLG